LLRLLRDRAIPLTVEARNDFREVAHGCPNLCGDSRHSGIFDLSGISLRFGLGIDRWILSNTTAIHSGRQPAGRMALISAVAFCTIGVALVLVNRTRGYRLAEMLVLISGAIALLAIAGYFTRRKRSGTNGAVRRHRDFFIIRGHLCLRAERGLMARVASNSFGGIMARRLLPAAVLIPVVLGWLQHEDSARACTVPSRGWLCLPWLTWPCSFRWYGGA